MSKEDDINEVKKRINKLKEETLSSLTITRHDRERVKLLKEILGRNLDKQRVESLGQMIPTRGSFF